MPLPQGYTIDQPQAGPNLPAGYKLDTPSQGRPDTSGSMALDFMQGGGAELIGTALGAYNLLRKIPGADKVLPPVSPEVQQYAEPPKTVAAKIGKLFTQAGEFAIPAGEVAAATKGAGLLARAGAQAATAGAVQGVKSGGDLPSAADAAALGAAGPVAGAALGAVAPVAGRVLRAAPSIAADALGVINPRLGNIARVGIKAAKAYAAGAEEAAPAAKAAAPAAAPAMDTEEQQLLDAIQRGQQNAAAQASVPPKAYTPRPPDYYGVKAAEVPPTQPAPSAPAPTTASAAPTAKIQPIRPEPAPVPTTPPTSSPTSEPTSVPTTPKPASGATAAKSARYADAISKWARDMGMTPKDIADQWGTTTPEVRGQILLELKRKGYLGANETIPNTSAPGIISALKAKAATIKPPAGFSLGAMKQ